MEKGAGPIEQPNADQSSRIEIIVSREYPGDGKRKPVAFPDPGSASVEMDGVRVITLPKLVELKLASGMTAPHRLRDLADVQELIRVRGLTAEFAEQLDGYVRNKYLELWNAVRDSELNPPTEPGSE